MPRSETIRLVGEPIPGRYLVRLVPKAWAVPACITVTADGLFAAIVDGAELPGQFSHDDLEQQLYDWITGDPPHPFLRVTLYGKRCSDAQYQHRLAMKRWAAQHAPWHPCLKPMTPMDASKLPARDF